MQKKKQRKHKVLLPKGFDASLPGGGLPAPNPERWLPKWQRSEFKKKKITSAQRKNEVVKGSQVRGRTPHCWCSARVLGMGQVLQVSQDTPRSSNTFGPQQ